LGVAVAGAPGVIVLWHKDPTFTKYFCVYLNGDDCKSRVKKGYRMAASHPCLVLVWNGSPYKGRWLLMHHGLFKVAPGYSYVTGGNLKTTKSLWVDPIGALPQLCNDLQHIASVMVLYGCTVNMWICCK